MRQIVFILFIITASDAVFEDFIVRPESDGYNCPSSDGSWDQIEVDETNQLDTEYLLQTLLYYVHQLNLDVEQLVSDSKTSHIAETLQKLRKFMHIPISSGGCQDADEQPNIYLN